MSPGSINFLTPIRIDGADASGFLHGQFTTDVTGLVPGQAGLSAWCDPQRQGDRHLHSGSLG